MHTFRKLNKPSLALGFCVYHWANSARLNLFIFRFRVRQRPTIKGTAMPGEWKALRPLRLVHRKVTSLLLGLRPPHHPQEPWRPTQTLTPAKQVMITVYRLCRAKSLQYIVFSKGLSLIPKFHLLINQNWLILVRVCWIWSLSCEHWAWEHSEWDNSVSQYFQISFMKTNTKCYLDQMFNSDLVVCTLTEKTLISTSNHRHSA